MTNYQRADDVTIELSTIVDELSSASPEKVPEDIKSKPISYNQVLKTNIPAAKKQNFDLIEPEIIDIVSGLNMYKDQVVDMKDVDKIALLSHGPNRKDSAFPQTSDSKYISDDARKSVIFYGEDGNKFEESLEEIFSEKYEPLKEIENVEEIYLPEKADGSDAKGHRKEEETNIEKEEERKRYMEEEPGINREETRSIKEEEVEETSSPCCLSIKRLMGKEEHYDDDEEGKDETKPLVGSDIEETDFDSDVSSLSDSLSDSSQVSEEHDDASKMIHEVVEKAAQSAESIILDQEQFNYSDSEPRTSIPVDTATPPKRKRSILKRLFGRK